MLFRRFALCLVVASIVTPARASADLPVLQSGTYREVDPRNGTLVRGPLANTLVIVRTGSGALRFSVTAFRPRGAAEGDAANTLPTVVLGALPAGRHRVAWSRTANPARDELACTLVFTADRPETITVRQDRRTCFLGYGVTANGRYRRTSPTGTLAQPFFHE